MTATLESLLAMPEIEMDRIAADVVMGWPVRATFVYDFKIGRWINPECKSQIHLNDWHPSTDYNDAAMLRAKIAERGLKWNYWMILRRMTVEAMHKNGTSSPESLGWGMVAASPLEITIACILAAQEPKQ